MNYQPDYGVSFHAEVEREYVRDEDGKLNTVRDTGNFRITPLTSGSSVVIHKIENKYK